MESVFILLASTGLAIAGWFLSLEIKRLRQQIDLLLDNQKEMAVQIGKLEEKLNVKSRTRSKK